MLNLHTVAYDFVSMAHFPGNFHTRSMSVKGLQIKKELRLMYHQSWSVILKEVMPRAWPLCVVFFSSQAHLFMCNSKTLASKLLLFKGEEEVVTTPLPPSNCSLLCPRHGVWKSLKKYYLTLRAKRATFSFWDLSG